MAYKRKRIPKDIRDRLLVDAMHRCCLCPQHEDITDIHHIVPINEKGPNTEENLMVVCPTCHAKIHRIRRMYTPEQLRMYKERWVGLCAKGLTLEERLAEAPGINLFLKPSLHNQTEPVVNIVEQKDIGPYLPATEHEETLYSNLLEVKRLPSSIYSASTDYRTPEEIFDWSKENDINLTSGWLLTEKMIRSVYDLREEPWTQICDRGSVEKFGIDEWSDSSDPDIQREFVRLMNQTLRRDMSIRHLWHSKDVYRFFNNGTIKHLALCRF